MGVGTFEQYKERMYKMKPNIYIGKEVIDRKDPRVEPGMYVMRQTFDCAHDERYRDICTATSHLTGETIVSVNSSPDKVPDKKDLQTKIYMIL
jgi:4-hydroxyphenylacetate 3-monooxygenase/4-hydroxybutyryl-CoA dehydratase/vinylacetyl-CoA-Delta-isomerase